MGAGDKGHWFESLAEHLGEAYLRYSFTKGTEQEVDFLTEVLQLPAGSTVLDVGCGPGRHVFSLCRRGMAVTGVDRSARFVKLGSSAGVPGAQFVRADARALPCRNGSFDVAISLCQGGFGLLGGHDDGDVLCEMAQAVKMGGYVVVSAFSAYFQLRFLEDSDAFDADAGVNHERTEIRSPTGAVLEADLWTTCFTPRELRLLAERAGLTVKHLWSVTPGRYGRFSPITDLPEFLLVAQRQIHGVGTEEHAVLT